MSDAPVLIQAAGLGDTLGTLLFLVVFFIAPVIRQVLSERKKQATLEESRRKREERQGGESPGLPGPLDVDDEPTPPFPWEMVEVQDVAPPEPTPVPVPVPMSVSSPKPESIVTISHSPLTDADWGHLQDAPQEPVPISAREARRMLEHRSRRGRVNWRRAVVTAELLAPPVALRGPSAGSSLGLGAPTGLG